MGRPRTSRSTIKNDPFATVIPSPEPEASARAAVQVVSRTARRRRAGENVDRPAEPTPAPAVAQTQRPSETNRSAGADQKMQVLWCEPGEHEWERPSVPGRKPKTCPTHV